MNVRPDRCVASGWWRAAGPAVPIRAISGSGGSPSWPSDLLTGCIFDRIEGVRGLRARWGLLIGDFPDPITFAVGNQGERPGLRQGSADLDGSIGRVGSYRPSMRCARGEQAARKPHVRDRELVRTREPLGTRELVRTREPLGTQGPSALGTPDRGARVGQ